MKRFLALCLMTCLSLPALSGTAILTVGLSGAAMLVSPTPAFADVEEDAGLVETEGDSHAAADDHEERAKPPILSFDFGSAFWNLVVFVCVLAVLSIFVWPSVLGGLQSREDKIREDLETAEKANAEAQAILAGYQTKLDEAATQTHAMLAEARSDAEANGQRIVEQAKVEAAAQRERAVADIENAKKVAMADIASRTSDMAMQVARGVVGRELNAQDHADLVAKAMKRLPSNN
ncbi:F0F1 ATP synthase subunit B family protein [Allorhodopirellula solitaria]|uniref:ATP synthase subunit b n=1 Tax=Allorhodopirellula solitaria TaxID=2527987 RepID=A0A5C5X016_9BACT|nr:ATP synthase F0 subunit B [Allorhodopirellula solitaria]TWT56337.1 ATP synthase subunit b [Allorhodopirellula solitaria]